MVTQTSKKPAVVTRRKAPRTNGLHPARPAASHTQALHAPAADMPHDPANDPMASAGGLVSRGRDMMAREAGGLAAVVALGVGAALIEVELIPGLVLGAGAILLGKLFPELGGRVRPLVKGAVNAGFSVAEKAREMMAEANEQAHDLVAEVRHERQQSRSGPAAGVATGRVAGAKAANGAAGAVAH